MDAKHTLDRRRFLGRAAKAAAAAVAAPLIVPRAALGGPGYVAANDRLALGTIGCGGQGSGDMGAILGSGQVELVAACDVYQPHRERAAQRGREGVRTYNDFRDLLGRDDIDIVNIGTPDHWHALIAIAACQAGKDIYLQKPMTLTIREGRALVDAVRRYNRILQVGSQQRSEFSFRRACELVRSGRIGKVQYVDTRIGGNPTCGYDGFGPVPDGMDWEMYLGPAPWVPYNRHRTFWDFRWFWDYSGGNMTDWGAHHNDIAQWGLGTDATGPVEITGAGEFPTSGLMETPVRFQAAFRYGDGREVRCSSEGNMCTFHGADGWIECNRGGHLKASKPEIVNEPLGPGDVHLYESDNHYQNFVDCVRTRREPVCPVEVGHRSVSVCHLGNISIRLGRPIRWDPEKEEIVGDEEAARWVGKPMRKPWHL